MTATSLAAEHALRLALELQAARRDEAAAYRLAAFARRDRPRFGRLRASLAAVRSALATVEPVKPPVPKLSGYPYRG